MPDEGLFIPLARFHALYDGLAERLKHSEENKAAVDRGFLVLAKENARVKREYSASYLAEYVEQLEEQIVGDQAVIAKLREELKEAYARIAHLDPGCEGDMGETEQG